MLGSRSTRRPRVLGDYQGSAVPMATRLPALAGRGRRPGGPTFRSPTAGRMSAGTSSTPSRITRRPAKSLDLIGQLYAIEAEPGAPATPPRAGGADGATRSRPSSTRSGRG